MTTFKNNDRVICRDGVGNLNLYNQRGRVICMNPGFLDIITVEFDNDIMGWGDESRESSGRYWNVYISSLSLIEKPPIKKYGIALFCESIEKKN
jgi:hypothetical protein